MKILIIGAGAYVTGRNKSGIGTILSTIAQASKELPIIEVFIVARSQENQMHVESETNRINSTLNTNLKVSYRCLNSDDVFKEIAALCQVEMFDCCIVSTPDHLHYEHIKAAITNNMHVLTVKPFVLITNEAKELIDLANAHNVYGAVEFHKRFDESNLYVKNVVHNEELGDILYANVNYSQRIINPVETFSQWSDKSNIFQYLGVHYVDLIYFITGFYPTGLCAYGTAVKLKSLGINTFDSIHVMLEWQNQHNPNKKFISQFNTNWVDPNCTSAMSDQKINFVGTEGRIECDQKNRGVQLVNNQAFIQDINPYFSEYLLDANGNKQFSGYGYKSIKQFLDDVLAIKHDKIIISELNKLRPSFKEALVSTRVIESVNLALKEKPQWISVNEVS